MRIMVKPVFICKNCGFVCRIASLRAFSFKRTVKVYIITKNLFVFGYIAYIPAKGFRCKIISKEFCVYFVVGKNVFSTVSDFIAVCCRSVGIECNGFLKNRRIVFSCSDHLRRNRSSVNNSANLVELIKLIGAYCNRRCCHYISVQIGDRSYLEVIGVAHLICKCCVIARFFDINGNLIKCVLQLACVVCFMIVCAIRCDFLKNIYH